MVKHEVANEKIWGYLLRYDQEDSIIAALVSDREGQDNKRDSNVPLWLVSRPQHAGKEHQPSLFQGTQCPDRASTLYLTDRSLAWVEASQSPKPGF